MTAVEIIEEIKRLPHDERARVIDFARLTGDSEKLSANALGELAKRLAVEKDLKEADRLQAEIKRGFYGGSHA